MDPKAKARNQKTGSQPAVDNVSRTAPKPDPKRPMKDPDQKGIMSSIGIRKPKRSPLGT